MIVDPLIAEGAGLAARSAGQLLIGVPRADDPAAATTVCPEEYRRLYDAGMGKPEQFAARHEKLTYAFFSYVENTIAGAGDVVNGRGELFLSPANLPMLRVVPQDGGAPLELPVSGVPVVAERIPLQKQNGAWAGRTDLSIVDSLPAPLFRWVRDALRRQLKVTAAPISTDFGAYCGYSLLTDAPITVRSPDGTTISTVVQHRIDVTAAAGYVFPYSQLPPGEDRVALAARIASALDANEPQDVIGDFESRYLASATIARYYQLSRQRERALARNGA